MERIQVRLQMPPQLRFDQGWIADCRLSPFSYSGSCSGCGSADSTSPHTREVIVDLTLVDTGNLMLVLLRICHSELKSLKRSRLCCIRAKRTSPGLEPESGSSAKVAFFRQSDDAYGSETLPGTHHLCCQAVKHSCPNCFDQGLTFDHLFEVMHSETDCWEASRN